MAKAKKQKQDEQQQQQKSAASSSCAVVRHQKLCLAIDMENRTIYGHTEIKIVAPDSGVIGLHARNLNIDKVLVDGVPARFTYKSQHEDAQKEQISDAITFVKASEIAGSIYLSSLEKELVPELMVYSEDEKSKEINTENDEDGRVVLNQPMTKQEECLIVAQTEKVKIIRIEYWIENPEVGVYFVGNTLHTNNQLRRARCWFPCIDCCLQRCCYDMEFTVDSQYVVVSSGNLLYQVMSKDVPSRKTFVYNINIPVTAESVTLAVGSFDVFPDSHKASLSYMCMPSDHTLLQCSISFFHNVFSYYEDYLATPFPFGSYKQVFIDSESISCTIYAGASLSICSSHLLHSEQIIDQVISTRIKLAYALAQQWFGIYITAESDNDRWLMHGLAGFLTDCYIKRYMGNNEARYRRYKANELVCKFDTSGATALSSSVSAADLYGTDSLGLLGAIRSWKAVAVLQMLEKQMGPDAFRKVLQRILHKAQDKTRGTRTLNTTEFRHLANKIGNLERPFLKEFFPRWVELSGCPVLSVGFAYNKKRNMIELAVIRGCTSDPADKSGKNRVHGDFKSGEEGWPGMMSVRVYEHDGMYDHPSLPMAGDAYQLLEIQCHSKLAARRIQRTKKGGKPDGSDDNTEVQNPDLRNGMESPLLWLRADPELEYLAMIDIYQPVQMWINQLEKERDIVAQLQAIVILSSFNQISMVIINALSNCLNDTKVFWRVRVESAFALARTASEETNWAGLTCLTDFYKKRRFDTDADIPRPNDFRDLPEYFVLEAIPSAIVMVRDRDGKTLPEAVTFILQLLKYNDNNGNPFSDAYWLAAIVDSVGKIEFGQESIDVLPSLLKRIEFLLQFDRLMPSYNGVITISCIRALKEVALRLSNFLPMERISEVLSVFLNPENTSWRIRLEVYKAFLDLEAQRSGVASALSSAINFIQQEASVQGRTKTIKHCLYLCQARTVEKEANCSAVFSALLEFLSCRMSFVNDVNLRHEVFCILQILAGRSPTLFGFSTPKSNLALANHIGSECVEEQKLQQRDVADKEKMKTADHDQRTESKVEMPNYCYNEVSDEQRIKSGAVKIRGPKPLDTNDEDLRSKTDAIENLRDGDATVSCSSGGNERRVPFKIRLKPRDSADNLPRIKDNNLSVPEERGVTVFPVTSSSMSVDAGLRVEAAQDSMFTHGSETKELGGIRAKKSKFSASSSHGNGSHRDASFGKPQRYQDYDVLTDIQCTADSKNVASVKPHPAIHKSNARQAKVLPSINNRSPVFSTGNYDNQLKQKNGFSSQNQKQRVHADQLSLERDVKRMEIQQNKHIGGTEREIKKDKKRKRDKHNDPEYLERKRLKKERRRQEKALMQKQLNSRKADSADMQMPETSSRCSTGPEYPNELHRSISLASLRAAAEPGEMEINQRLPRNSYIQSSRNAEDGTPRQRLGASQGSSGRIRIKVKKYS